MAGDPNTFIQWDSRLHSDMFFNKDEDEIIGPAPHLPSPNPAIIITMAMPQPMGTEALIFTPTNEPETTASPPDLPHGEHERRNNLSSFGVNFGNLGDEPEPTSPHQAGATSNDLPFTTVSQLLGPVSISHTNNARPSTMTRHTLFNVAIEDIPTYMDDRTTYPVTFQALVNNATSSSQLTVLVIFFPRTQMVLPNSIHTCNGTVFERRHQPEVMRHLFRLAGAGFFTTI